MRKRIIILLVLLIASFLRFYNLMHDSPYFFNPDERNMAIAISQFRLPSQPKDAIQCLTSEFVSPIFNSKFSIFNEFSNFKFPASPAGRQISNCNMNPHFFAYGQFPLYLAFFSDQVTKPISNLFNLRPRPKDDLNQRPIDLGSKPLAETINYLSTSHPSAIFWLRFWSALSSTLTVLFVYLITKELIDKHQAPSTKYQTNLKHQAPNTKQFGICPPATLDAQHLRAGNLEFGHYAALIAAFTPGLIQSAHFGTTESLLTFFFLASTYFSIRLLTNPYNNSFKKLLIHNSCLAGRQAKFIILNSLVVGLAIGTKATGIIFLAPLILYLMIQIIRVLTKRRKKWPTYLLGYLFIGLLVFIGIIIFSIISSPFNLIDLQGFKGSVFGYEMDVAIGKYEAFYTRQFVDTAPILFQMEKIFPYALGWPIFILGSIGLLLIMIKLFHSLILLIWNRIMNHESCLAGRQVRIKNKKNIDKLLYHDSYFLILASSFLIYFLPNAFLFAKWTRFMTPILPFFAVFAGYFLFRIYSFISTAHPKSQSSKLLPCRQAGNSQIYIVKLKNYLFNNKLLLVLTFAICILSLLPGAAFMSIYTHEDVRVTASRWIWQNIPDKSYLLFETANVIDIPLGIPSENLGQKNYQMVSFDYYHIDDNKELFDKLLFHLEKADYIFIPSRRIFANFLRLPERYPLVTKYYQLLYSGALGFEKVAQFNSFPQLPISQIGPIGLISNDESAEESFTVFDHPVIRIYRKIKSFDKQYYQSLFII